MYFYTPSFFIPTNMIFAQESIVSSKCIVKIFNKVVLLRPK